VAEPSLPTQLHLDDLLAELQTRLQAIIATRDRLHRLLDAVVAIGGALDLQTVLRRVVEAATELVDAKYGALGVLGDGDELAQFVTTGLDADSTRLVVGALRSLMRGTTTIIISHDPSLVRCADRVLVVEDGGIPEVGTPAVLQRAGGRYTELMRGWSDDDGRDAPEANGSVDGSTVDQIIHRLKADGSPLLGTGRPHRHAKHSNGRPPA